MTFSRFRFALVACITLPILGVSTVTFGEPQPDYRVQVPGAHWGWLERGVKDAVEVIGINPLGNQISGRLQIDESRAGTIRIRFSNAMGGLGYSMKKDAPELVVTEDVKASEWEKIPFKDPNDPRRVGFHLRVANGPHNGMYLDFDPVGKLEYRLIGSSDTRVRVHTGRLSPAPTQMSLVAFRKMGDLKADSP